MKRESVLIYIYMYIYIYIYILPVVGSDVVGSGVVACVVVSKNVENFQIFHIADTVTPFRCVKYANTKDLLIYLLEYNWPNSLIHSVAQTF